MKKYMGIVGVLLGLAISVGSILNHYLRSAEVTTNAPAEFGFITWTLMGVAVIFAINIYHYREGIRSRYFISGISILAVVAIVGMVAYFAPLTNAGTSMVATFMAAAIMVGVGFLINGPPQKTST